MDQCTVTNILGVRCQLGVGHERIGMPHDFPPPAFSAGPHDHLATLTVERDAARAELAQLCDAVAREGGAAGFFLAAWKSANLRIAELEVELARERERTAGLLGAVPVTAATSLRDVMSLVYRYADANVQDELAAQRDAGHATLKRNAIRLDEWRAKIEAALVALGATR